MEQPFQQQIFERAAVDSRQGCPDERGCIFLLR